jgi:hypothetical protein
VSDICLLYFYQMLIQIVENDSHSDQSDSGVMQTVKGKNYLIFLCWRYIDFFIRVHCTKYT